MNGRDLGGAGGPAACQAAPAGNSFPFLALAGAAAIFTGLIYAVLTVCYVLMVRDPSYGFWPTAEPPAEAAPAAAANPPDDPDGTVGITFTRGDQNHFFRRNNHAGNILILTGTVRSNYDHPRSFIKLKGQLLSADGESLAERFVYAGHTLSEDDLEKLPLEAIEAELAIASGRNYNNVHIQPGWDIPFMMVFGRLPDGLAEYRIDPAGSEPAN